MANTDLISRANELSRQGHTQLRAFRALKREFPEAQTDVIWMSLRTRPPDAFPSWATRVGSDGKIHASGGFPVGIRRDPRPPGGAPAVVRTIPGRKEEIVDATTIKIDAHDLREGDHIKDEGVVSSVWTTPKGTPRIVACVGEDIKIMPLDERLVVHLEDYGDAS